MEIGTFSIVIGVLLAISETLALIPGVESNGIFQVVWRLLKILAGAKEKEDC